MIEIELDQDSFNAVLRELSMIWGKKYFHISPQILLWNDIREQLSLCEV